MRTTEGIIFIHKDLFEGGYRINGCHVDSKGLFINLACLMPNNEKIEQFITNPPTYPLDDFSLSNIINSIAARTSVRIRYIKESELPHNKRPILKFKIKDTFHKKVIKKR